MKKLATLAVLATGLLVLPAQAKPPHPAHPNKCAVHKVGYHARGTLVSQSLTQTQGAATATTGDDRYSGSITVNVTKANHGAPTGNQTYNLTNAKVKFHVPDRTGDGKRTLADVRAGDRVRLQGKITHLARRCDHTGFTPTVTVKKVDFNKPRA
jgi:hypothetical protein